MAAQTQASNVLSTEHLKTNLKGRTVRGGAVTVGAQACLFLISSVSTMVMARILTPADFGLVAMVTTLVAVAQGFADLGLSEATIQRREISMDQISTLFWINVGAGAALTVLTAALAPLFVWFYREPRLRDITLASSLTFLICSLRVQHDALLKRQMRFFSLAVRDVTSFVVGVPAGIVMALRGAGYWAIVAIPLITNLTQVLLSWLMVRWIPGPPRRGAGVRSMVAFGGNVAVSYLTYNMMRSADNVLVGWYWGPAPLGLYSKAYSLLMLPVRQLSAPLGNVLVPAFSRLQDDPDRFARYYLRAANLITWFGTPIFGFLFVAAEPVIVILLGSRWKAAVPVFELLAISAFAQLLLGLTVWLLVSGGRSKRLVKLYLMISPVIVGSYAVGLPFGIKGVALSSSLVLVSIFPWMMKFTFRETALNLLGLGRAIACPISICLCGVFCAELTLRLMAPARTISQLLVIASTFVAVYALAALVRPVRQEIVSLRQLFGSAA